MSERRFLTRDEAAKILRVHTDTLVRWIKSGKVPAVRVGSRVLISSAVIDRFERQALSSTNNAGVDKSATARRTGLSVWREREGLSQRQAARQVGISRTYLCMVERGFQPSDDIAGKLERATTLPIHELMARVAT